MIKTCSICRYIYIWRSQLCLQPSVFFINVCLIQFIESRFDHGNEQKIIERNVVDYAFVWQFDLCTRIHRLSRFQILFQLYAWLTFLSIVPPFLFLSVCFWVCVCLSVHLPACLTVKGVETTIRFWNIIMYVYKIHQTKHVCKLLLSMRLIFEIYISY